MLLSGPTLYAAFSGQPLLLMHGQTEHDDARRSTYAARQLMIDRGSCGTNATALIDTNPLRV
jgi:hypothetical protein